MFSPNHNVDELIVDVNSTTHHTVPHTTVVATVLVRTVFVGMVFHRTVRIRGMYYRQ